MTSRILLFTFCSMGFAADCVPVAGERVLAGDLARAVPAFAGLPPELALGYAPAPGSRRAYSAAELARLAGRYGLTIEPGLEACLARPAGTLTPERVTAAMLATVPQARIEVLELSRQPVPLGELHFPISGLSGAQASEPASSRLWRGQVRQPGRDDFPIWAKVRILISGTRAVASDELLPRAAYRALPNPAGTLRRATRHGRSLPDCGTELRVGGFQRARPSRHGSWSNPRKFCAVNPCG